MINMMKRFLPILLHLPAVAVPEKAGHIRKLFAPEGPR